MKTDTIILEPQSEPEIDKTTLESHLAEEEYNPTGIVYVLLMYTCLGAISVAIGVGLLLFVYTVVDITLCLITGQPIK